MIPVLRVTLTILLQLIICHSGVSSLKVAISPKNPLFRLGDSQKLTCQVSQCSGEATFLWGSLEDRPLYAEIQSSSSESTLLFKSVTKNHENKFLCTGNCKGTNKQTSTTVRVYSFAKDPIISGHKNLVSGKEKSTLTCEISDVYPAERMTLEWVRGGEVVHREDGEYGKTSIQSNYKFTPEITNNNEPITCRVTLSLDGLPETESTRETTVSMTVLCPPVNTLISVSPKNPKENEFFKISCVSDSSPVGHMVLSKVLDENETELVSGEGPQVSVSYSKANFSLTGLYTCTTTNPCGRKTDNITVIVSAFAKDPIISGHKNLVSGKEKSTLTCEISDVYPAERMTLEWVRGGEVVHREDGEYGKTSIQSNYKFTPEITNNNEPITCRVTLSLDGLPETESTRNTTVSMTVLSFSSDPTIKNSGLFLEGQVTNLTCTVLEVFPAGSFDIRWLYEERVLNLVRGNSSDKPQNLSLTIPFKPKDTDRNKTFTCVVSLEMEGLSRKKTVSTTKTVQYSPKNTTIDVRPHKKPSEGENVTISCQTDSSPEGHVTLKRELNGEEIELVSSNGTQTSVTISFTTVSHSGNYICEAVNKYGHQRKDVQITVQAPPKNITVSVYPAKEVQEGENITICCQSVSFPPSNITLRKLINGNDIYSSNGTFQLVNLTSNDSGLYQVIATNVLGFEIENFTLNVTSKRKAHKEIYKDLFEKLTSVDFIIPAIGVGILASVISALGLIRKAKMKGAYEMSEVNTELP